MHQMLDRNRLQKNAQSSLVTLIASAFPGRDWRWYGEDSQLQDMHPPNEEQVTGKRRRVKKSQRRATEGFHTPRPESTGDGVPSALHVLSLL